MKNASHTKLKKLGITATLTTSVMSLVGCGTFTGIPAHGGGKRFSEEQRIISASARSTISKIDVSALYGHKVAVVYDFISDEGGGTLSGGRMNLLGSALSAYTMSPVVSTVGSFQVFNLTDRTTSYGNNTNASTSTGSAASTNVVNTSGSSSSTGQGSSTTNGTQSNSSTGSTSNSGSSTSTTNGSGSNTSTGSTTGSTTGSNSSTSVAAGNTTSTTTTTGGTNNTTEVTNGSGSTTTTTNGSNSQNSSSSNSTSGTSSNSSTTNGSSSGSSNSTNSGSGTSSETGTSSSSSSGTSNSAQTGSGTQSNSSTGTGTGTNSQTTVVDRQVLSTDPSSTERSTNGNGQRYSAELQYKGMGEYTNFAVPKSDASYLMGLVRNYLLLSGVEVTVPTDKSADTLLYVTVDVFGTNRSRFDAYLINKETLKAETAIEMMAFDKSGRLIMRPQSSNDIAKYEEVYLFWAGPFYVTESVKAGTGLLKDWGDVRETAKKRVEARREARERGEPYRRPDNADKQEQTGTIDAPLQHKELD